MMKLRLFLLVVLAALFASPVHAQNSGQLPINAQQDKLEKTIVGTAIIGMRDKRGDVVATFAFNGAAGKCPIYRLAGFDFVHMAKIDNLQVDSVDTTLFPSFDAILRLREDCRPNYSSFNSRLDRIQVGPQTLFMGNLLVNDSGTGDNAIFSHAVTKHKERIKILWLFEASKDRRNWLQDSLPVVVRDVERGQEKDALAAMARAGWEFTSMSDQRMFTAMAQASQVPDFLRDFGKNVEDIDKPGRQTNTQNVGGSMQVEPSGLDAKPVVFRLAGTARTSVAECTKGQRLEVDYPGSFRVVFIKISADKSEKTIFDQPFQNQARLPLDLMSGCTYRVEVRDPANGNMLMATIRLEAK